MSVQAMSWAMAQTTGSGTRKAVLLALANCHNHHTGRCCPSISRLSQETEFSERTVRNALNDLEGKPLGLISRLQRVRKDGTRGVYDYTLNMEADSEPPAGGAGGPAAGGAAQEPEVDLEPSEETYVSSASGPDSAKKTAVEELWDAAEEYVQKAPQAKSPRAAFAKLIREMVDAGWTPEMVRVRARAYKRHPTLGVTMLTLAALAKWGEELDHVADRFRRDGPVRNGAEPELELLPAEENARRMRELAALVAGDAIGVPSPASSALPHAPEAGGPPPMPSPGPPAPRS